MAHKTLTPFSLVCLFLLLAMLNGSQATSKSVYWGQNGKEGNLSMTCQSGIYDIVNIAYLSKFGSGQKMSLNLSTHCDPAKNCSALSGEIEYCQKLGIKVFLSIGGDFGIYNLSSRKDASVVAEDILNSYFTGQPWCGIWGYHCPLDNAILDGIDFDLSLQTNTQYWNDLVKALLNKFRFPYRKVYLSAAVGCSYPDRNLDDALHTGLFDYVWVKFYNDRSCEYSGSVAEFLSTWGYWRTFIRAKAFYIGLTPSTNATNSGFIAIDTLNNYILPTMERDSKYDGIMISSRYWDLVTKYSRRIRDTHRSPSLSDKYQIYASK